MYLFFDEKSKFVEKILCSHYVANFFFSVCPSICPKMMRNLLALQDTFARNKDIKLLSFSVMPWVDSVKQLKKYGAANDINPNQ